ncbi:MAG: hypothetical protein LBG75_00830 [Candidatus Nomurabacteria bacterium]|nr:hypothetical protein [Candidatus Nomurabacteria bacterium]
MNKFIIIEVGSTNTKPYLVEGDNITELPIKPIHFKDNYRKSGKILTSDKQELFDLVEKLRTITPNIFVYGTSIFRNLSNKECAAWLKEFKTATGLSFETVTADMENDYTVHGVTSGINYSGRLAVMIGGGGSTELAIIENGQTVETINHGFGAGDITHAFPDLAGDRATSSFDQVLDHAKGLASPPQSQADLLVLAGGDYLMFYETLGYPLVRNSFYTDQKQPFQIDAATMHACDQDFFYKTSLNDVIERAGNEQWWRGTRGMRICVKTIVDLLDAKHIIPSRISMVYGIARDIGNRK